MSKKVSESLWLILAFIVPFTTVGGFWAFLTWMHAINDAGRSGEEISAFAAEAIIPALQALLSGGLPWGILGLVLAFGVMKFRKR
jgi:hypothetical protein